MSSGVPPLLATHSEPSNYSSRMMELGATTHRLTGSSVHGQQQSMHPIYDPVAYSMSESFRSIVANEDSDPFCKWVLYWEFGNTRIRVWDLAILLPNAIFLVALALGLERARHKLRATTSAIFTTFYVLVVVNTFASLVRCVVSMTVNAALPAGSRTDKVLWVVVRFFLLSTELSVVIFGLAFGHLDSRTSIQRVLIFTSLLSLTYSISQGALEIVTPDENFYVPNKDYNIFAHGGMLFWFTSSVVFAILYILIFMLPWTRLRERLTLPTKRSFYCYIVFLALLNMVQAIGSGLLYYRQGCGLCMVDITTYIYFTLFTPLVYRTFLSDFFSVSQQSIQFSYKAQVDEAVEEDNVSLPYQLSCSSLKTDSDYIYQNNLLYDSTQFDPTGTPVNPLYAHSLQSPDSLNDYDDMPRSSSINSDPGPPAALLAGAASVPSSSSSGSGIGQRRFGRSDRLME